MSIKIKFTILIVIFILFLVSILTWLSISRQQKLLLESTEKRILILMQNAADTVKEGLITADDLLIANTIRKIKGRNEDIIHSYILDKKGRLIFHSDNTIMINALGIGDVKQFNDPLIKKSLQSDSFLKSNAGKYFLYSYPIFDNNNKIGTIFIEYDFQRIMKNIRLSTYHLILISVLILFCFIIITYFFTSYLLTPVKRLAEGVKIIGGGNLDHKIYVSQNDELGDLAVSFNAMTKELKISRQKLIEKELLERDLEIASEIQQFLIPRLIPRIERLSLYAFYQPAHFVGGDYYDIIEIGEDKYGIIIIDVSGKGSGAAIIMAVITFIFHSEAFKTYDSSRLMYELNNKLIDRIPDERFATGIYLIYDAKKEVIQFTNAGHSNLLLYQKTSDKVIEIDKAASMPLGIAKNIQYNRFAFKLNKGDTILLQTDGIYEAMNEEYKEFSNEQVKLNFLNIAKNSDDPESISQKLIAVVKEFCGNAKQHDDMTLITIKKL